MHITPASFVWWGFHEFICLVQFIKQINFNKCLLRSNSQEQRTMTNKSKIEFVRKKGAKCAVLKERLTMEPFLTVVGFC
jgi:hypothetical protein